MGKKILIVEDEYIIGLDLQMMFEDLGHEVTSIADSCDQALKSIEKIRPDIITMDVRIHGDKDGITTTAIVNEKYEIPVVYLTAYTDEKTRARINQTENLGVLSKPPDERAIEELFNSI